MDKLVTEQWLRSIGFTDTGVYALHVEIPNPWTDRCKSYLVCGDFCNAAECPWEVQTVYNDGSDTDRAMLISELPLQRDVLTLCKVLRINLNL